MIGRRRFLAGAGALLATRALAEPLRDGPWLPAPDFTRLRADHPYVVGIRPHRLGGVRIGLDDQPLPGGKRVVHAYGHGGAGITLAWGTAELVVDEVARAFAAIGEPGPVAVVGTGVVGLTAASLIRRRWPELALTVYAADLDLRTTTSWIAGGQFEPSGIWREYQKQPDVLADLLRRSKRHLLRLDVPDGRYGVVARDNYALDHELRSVDTYTPRDVLAEGRHGTLPFEHLRAPGRVFPTWLMNPTLLLPTLKAELEAAGVRFVQRRFASPAEVGAVPEALVVNATGYGARALFDDDRVIPQRGHLVILDRTDPRQDWLFSGGCEDHTICYVFCRQDDVVVGGTITAGDDDPAIRPGDAPVFGRILANAVSVFAGHADRCLAR
ncbi:MAG: FAD-binding oxidoreductase [Alphaproteobacteria bacterium]|nr:FAD-binding oxidoreductase [Alphaproteobacteria bacterium]MCB9697698.1 FAD-binding oxidoreductase [Alphaproteobacteria bacterium]